MRNTKKWQYTACLSLLLTVTGCSTLSPKSDTSTASSKKSSAMVFGKKTTNKDAAAPYFTSAELQDIKAAFKPGSCDLTKLNEQTAKYNLSDTWVNLYERTPKPLSELSQQDRCFLAQSTDLYAYTDDFYAESANTLNKSWFKGHVPTDAEVVTMRYMTPTVLIPNCDPELGRPIIVDFEKDSSGNIQRTIFVNEDFDHNCLK